MAEGRISRSFLGKKYYNGRSLKTRALKAATLHTESLFLMAAHSSPATDSFTLINPFHMNPMRSGTRTLWMELCQVAYLRAVAVQACCSVAKPEPDIHKIDFEIKHESAHIPIGVQLKSTYQDIVREDFVVFEIDKATHDVMRRDDPYRRFLLVMVLPKTDAWVIHREGGLELRRCMYWLDVKGEAALDTASKTYHIPRTQMVTPEWLCGVFRSYFEEEDL